MRPVVFLGPSLPREEAEAVLDADYRPPVKRGDLSGLENVEVVGIIDGVFLQSCSVGHREILSLLNRKVRMIGGGSMGALRAAEMNHYGMIGVGRVFEMYAKGEIQGDDEVALVFDPETMEPLSEPLVNMRFFLDQAVADGTIGPEQRTTVLEKLRSVYYPRRTKGSFERMAAEVLDESEREAFQRYFTIYYRDIKREDALTVLDAVKKACSAP